MISFREKVYEITKKIPRGKVATYSQIARLAGKPKASRAVGYFMKTNPLTPIIPCHRVVAKDGGLTGYSASGGLSAKKRMLISEGVRFKKNKVDLKTSQWLTTQA